MLSVEPGRRYWYRWDAGYKAVSGRCNGVCGDKVLFESPLAKHESRVVKIEEVYAEAPEIAVNPWWKFW